MALPPAALGDDTDRADPGDPVAIFREYRRTGDSRLRDEIVARHAGLVRHLATRFAHRGEELDDLVQVGFWALLKAIERFDPDRGVAFASFAVPTVLGQLKRHFRDVRWNVRVPRSVQENFLRVRAATDELTQELGSTPPVAAVADRVGLTVDEVLEALDAGSSFVSLSLTDPSDSARQLTDNAVGHPCPELKFAESRREAAWLLSQLPVAEQRILWLRFAHDLTQDEIATRCGVSQMQVSRRLARSLQKLRALT